MACAQKTGKLGGEIILKILMIATEKLPVPPIRGGAIQTYMAGVLPYLSRKHDITVLGVKDPLLPTEENRDQVKYVRIPGKEVLEIYRDHVADYVKAHSFDLIHIFNRPKLLKPVRKAAPKARIVLSMHNDMFGSDKINQEEGAYAVEQAERIITISDYVGRTISSLFPAACTKVKTIYSGVDLSRFIPFYSKEAKKIRDTIRKENGLGTKQVILYVGRLSPKKGVDILVRAMPEVVKKHPNAALVLVGSSWYGQDTVSDYVGYVRSLAARSPVPVISTGFVKPDQVHKWFLAGDVFVCTSQWQEPLARVHYEAMAAGLPIITTPRGGNAEVIRENGYIVDQANDPAAFAKKISILLTNEQLRKKMGEKGRSLAEQKYDWARVAKEILEVWDIK
jgi:spore coat protein SA